MKLTSIVQEAPEDIYYLGLVNGKKITSEWKVTSDLNWAKVQAENYSKKHSADDISVIEILPGAKVGDGNNKVVHQVKGRVTEDHPFLMDEDELRNAVYIGVMKAIHLGQQNSGQVNVEDITAIVVEVMKAIDEL